MSLHGETWKSDEAIFVHTKTKTLEISLWRLSVVRFILILLFSGAAVLLLCVGRRKLVEFDTELYPDWLD